MKYLVHASYLEIYNEEIRDLLGKDIKRKLDLKEQVLSPPPRIEERKKHFFLFIVHANMFTATRQVQNRTKGRGGGMGTLLLHCSESISIQSIM